MLPTDAAMDNGSKCNAIQNALQKVEISISHQQAQEILIAMRKEGLIITFSRSRCDGCSRKTPV